MVIASNVGGLPEISDQEDFIPFPSKNTDELANRINYALQNYEEIRGISKKMVIEKFSWKKNIQLFLKLIDSNLKN